MDIANNIKKIIKERGLTSREVAENMGISKGTFSRTINNNPTVDSLEKIAAAIGCDIADFFTKKPEIHHDPYSFTCPHCGKPLVCIARGMTVQR